MILKILVNYRFQNICKGDKKMERMRYLLCLFIYALKEKEKISINTLFRYVYIYSVSSDYLLNEKKNDEEVIIDKNIGIGNYAVLLEALQSLNENLMITKVDAANIKALDKIYNFVEQLLEQERVRVELNHIIYFVGVVSNYSEDVILSIFYKEPNVEYASNRNESVVKLSNNKLNKLLLDFENVANNECGKNLEKYDVFTAWLDYVFEEYVQEKVE